MRDHQSKQITSAMGQALAMFRNGVALFISEMQIGLDNQCKTTDEHGARFRQFAYEGDHCTGILQHTALFFIIREMTSTA